MKIEVMESIEIAVMKWHIIYAVSNFFQQVFDDLVKDACH